HALAENIVCTQTKSGSNTWFAVCASDSFTTYSSASSISCVRATASSNNCIGGCAYGYECRSLSDSSTSGHCVEVIADDALHSCVEDLFEANSDHADDTVSPVLFSVASLKTLVTGFDDTPVLSCSGANVSDLAGIEHLTEITLIDLSCKDSSNYSDTMSDINISDFSLDSLTHLTNLQSLDLSQCIGIADSISHLSGIFNSLEELYLNNITLSEESISNISNFSNISRLEVNSCGLDVIIDMSLSSDSLLYLDIGSNSITYLLPIFVNSLYKLEVLIANDNNIVDPSPLYMLQDSLFTLDLSYNNICGIDEDDFESHFSLTADPGFGFVMSPQNGCFCSPIPSLSDNKISQLLFYISDTSSYCECNIGKGGSTCAEEMCLVNEEGQLCSGVGACAKDSTGEYHCSSCAQGYILNDDSSDCVSACSENYCGDHGQCIGINECLCDTGWSGNQCNIDSCGSELCSGSDHGECLRISPTKHECSCYLGWNGSTCSDEGCGLLSSGETACYDHGTCVQDDSGSSYCYCSPGWDVATACNTVNGDCGDSADSFCSGNSGECVSIDYLTGE
ncbi:hypothetical protein ADUPG1_011638, partial [Aduncisulcus paluster]